MRLHDHALNAGEILALYELPRPFRITAVYVEGNNVRITWTVQPGSAYIVQASTLIPDESTGEIGWADRTETIRIPETYPSPTFDHLDPGVLPGTDALFYRVKRLP